MSFSQLPNELHRKIINFLPHGNFIIINQIDKRAHKMKLHLQLIPHTIEGFYYNNRHYIKSYNAYVQEQHVYTVELAGLFKIPGFVYTCTEMNEEIERIVGCSSKYDNPYRRNTKYKSFNQYGFTSVTDFIDNRMDTQERTLRIGSIHKVNNSLLLRALVY